MPIQIHNRRNYPMIKIKTFIKALIYVSFLLVLIGCGEKGLVIKNGPAGPNTGELIDPLPEGLVPDKTNARHGANDLNPAIN